jgi:hypothetical protein
MRHGMQHEGGAHAALHAATTAVEDQPERCCSSRCLLHHPSTSEPGAGLLVRQSTSAARESRGWTRNFPQATTAAEFPASASDALALDSLLSPDERDVRQRVRQFAVSWWRVWQGLQQQQLAFVHIRSAPA